MPACVRTCPAAPGISATSPIRRAPVSRWWPSAAAIDLMPELGYRPTNKYLPPRPRAAASPATSAPAALDTAGPRAASAWLVDRVLSGMSPQVHPAPSIILFTTASGAGYGLCSCSGCGASALLPDSRFSSARRLWRWRWSA